MAYNHGKAERKWRLWKEAEEKLLRAYGVEESIIELLYTYDRAGFNSDRHFYRRLNDVGDHIGETIAEEQPIEVGTVADMLDKIENERLYQILVTVDKRTLQIVLLKIQGYSTKEIAPLVGLTADAIYARLDHLQKKLKQFKA